ncbi:hypothetical protein PF006_g33124, partial [Phytophthora fragariae]
AQAVDDVVSHSADPGVATDEVLLPLHALDSVEMNELDWGATISPLARNASEVNCDSDIADMDCAASSLLTEDDAIAVHSDGLSYVLSDSHLDMNITVDIDVALDADAFLPL